MLFYCAFLMDKYIAVLQSAGKEMDPSGDWTIQEAIPVESVRSWVSTWSLWRSSRWSSNISTASGCEVGRRAWRSHTENEETC